MASEQQKKKILKEVHERVYFIRERNKYLETLSASEKVIFLNCLYLLICKEVSIFRKVVSNLRSRSNHVIKGKGKSGFLIKNLGCTIDEFREYIENQFYDNPETGEKMSWDNYGINGWRLGYIIQFSNINTSNIEEFLKLVHYTNYQPVWVDEK